MADIVDFNAGRSRQARVEHLPPSGAQILFFTGVRYERDIENRDRGVPAVPVLAHQELRTRASSGLSLDLAAH